MGNHIETPGNHIETPGNQIGTTWETTLKPRLGRQKTLQNVGVIQESTFGPISKKIQKPPEKRRFSTFFEGKSMIFHIL